MRLLTRFAIAVLFAAMIAAAPAGAQSPLFPFTTHVPAQAVVGSTPARLAAYNALSPAQRQAAAALVRPYMQQAFAQALALRQSKLTSQDLLVHAPNLDGLVQHDLSRAPVMQSQLAIASGAGATTAAVGLYPASGPALPSNPPASQVTGPDLDHDGLPDNFENQLADAFTPFYFVSGGEPDNFATFLDAVPEAVAQRQGRNPLSYFRVKPLGFATGTNGVEYGIVQVNYLTLWDHDSGVALSGTCDVMVGVVSDVLGVELAHVLAALTGHDKDDEHSAALLAAPTVHGGFNLDPGQYFGIDYFTAAHEGTFFDHSAYFNPGAPIPANNHLELALSLNKHSTYTFNPDGLAMFPAELIDAYFGTVQALFDAGLISEIVYGSLLYAGDTLFLTCVVEHFSDQGGAFASPRINVGEPVAGSTLNGSGFILDPQHALPKLTETIWQVATPPLIVTVAPQSAFLDGGQSQQFQATVLNAPNGNQGVTWSLSPAHGAISQSGVYSAPSLVAGADTVTVTACSTSDATRCGSALAVLNPIAVSVSPKAAALLQDQALQLAATVTHASSSSVTWSLSPQVGAISAAGLYTAPATVAGSQAVTVSACSTLAAANCDTATVNLLAGDFSRFVPLTPCRVADTRNPPGPFGGPFLAGGSTRGFAIPSGACGVPAAARAYSLNVTAVPKATLGFLTMFPCGQPLPLASTLNSDGRVKAVAAVVPAGANGAVCAFATDDTDLVLDVDGYFVPATDAAALAFYPTTPCRLVDTRGAVGPLGGPSLAGSAVRTFPLRSSACGLPAAAQAYALNFTAVPKGPLGFLTTWPAGQPQPLVSTLNAGTGAVTANAAIVEAGTNGDLSVFVSNGADLVIDLNGYFAPPGAGGLSFFALPPCRALDTRNPAGSPPFSQTIGVDLVASGCVPASATAHVLNATVVPAGPLGFLTLWPQGTAQPPVSTLNAGDGAVTSNLAIVPAANGAISAFATDPTHLILDVSGFFAP
jgi:hypothetical protein